jgi:hypothetical protein
MEVKASNHNWHKESDPERMVTNLTYVFIASQKIVNQTYPRWEDVVIRHQ